MQRQTKRAWKAIAVIGVMVAIACVEGADARAVSAERAAMTDRPAAPAPVAPPVVNGTIRFSVATSGNAARYRVRERLMGRDLDNDAVGETQQVTGAMTVDSSGRLVAGQSRVVVQTAQFTSDSDRRDNYVRRRLLQVDSFPTVELVPTALRGSLTPLLATTGSSGPVKFELLGDLTVRGVTKPTTWQVTAARTGTQLTGQAVTKFAFADFGITKPRVPAVLSVADTITLEYDFTIVREAAPAAR